jgi:hypothetical protein
MKWISTNDELPEEGKYVLGIHNRGTWHDSKDQSHVNMVIVSLRKGISIKEREMMKSGEIDDPLDGPYSSMWGPGYMIKRSTVTSACDESGNNKRPYNWETFGPSSFFGQDITHWMKLPEPPPEYLTGKNKHVPIEEKMQSMVDTIKETAPKEMLEWLTGETFTP